MKHARPLDPAHRLRPSRRSGRLIGIALAFLLTAAGLQLMAAPAHAEVIDDIEYEVVDGQARVIGYSGPGGHVTIPASVQIDGQSYPVTTIRSRAFAAKNLTQVTFTGPLDSIGDRAFYDNDLTGPLSFPGAIGTIGYEAFRLNDGITDVTFGADVGTVGQRAFLREEEQGIGTMGMVTFGGSVETIVAGAFARAGATGVTFSGDVGAIFDHAFFENRLTNVTFGGGLRAVATGSFQRNFLSSVTLPAATGDLGQRVFADNPLTDVTFAGAPPKSIQSADFAPTLGDAAGLVVSYGCRYDAALHPGGFTSPVWEGYSAQVLSSPFTVSFELGGHGAPIDARSIACGQPVSAPPTPIEDGWTFTGWYTTPQLTDRYDFSTPVTDHLMLYAGWAKAPSVAGLTLSASATRVTAGESVTLTATGLDAAGNLLGDVTDQVRWSSSVGTDEFDGSSVTFATAGERTITALYPGGATATIVIEVAEASYQPPPAPGGDDDHGTIPEDRGSVPKSPSSLTRSGALPTTGSTVGGLLLLAAMTSAGSGAALLLHRRRVH